MYESPGKTAGIVCPPAFLTFTADHQVPLYPVAESALPLLADYVEACLRNEEACIVVGTTPYLDKLAEELRAKGLDIFQAKKKGQYILVCPQRMSRSTGCEQLPNSTMARMLKTVRALAKNSHRPMQVFCEPWLSDCLQTI